MNPEDVVRAELSAWSRLDVDEIVSYFAAEAVWDNVPLGAVSGHDEIRKLVKDYVDRMTHGDIEIVNLAAAGNVVLTERVDHFVYDGKTIHARVMGAFEVSGDKITAWRDYFDVPNSPS
ncbi:MAG: limonene,2-epoxide hydrolase [Mycobacterium sp.]|nr:limonene,2-epoxide hydrolase [Mycobacterium sp.]